jgi:hypothetical protein
VPNAIVWLDKLPLTPNGKLDRRVLSQTPVLPASDDFVAPETDAEQTIAAMWAELLGPGRVGVHDNFFHIGGHSLLAGRLVSRLRHDLGVELQMRDVFLHPTVAELASLVEENLIEQIEQLSEEESRLHLQADAE